MRQFGSPLLLDLKAGGAAATASITPTTTVVDQSFTLPQLRTAVGRDNYILCRGIWTKVSVVFDQAASGGSAVNHDDLFRMVASYKVNVPKLGVTHDPSVFTGPIAKHIIEFFSLGYRYADQARAQIAAADGDTTCVLYTFLPFTQECEEDCEQFWPWVGVLSNMELTMTIATAATIAAVSTGAVSKTPCTLSAWLECYVSPVPVIPAISQWNKYTTNAASGQNLAQALNIGEDPKGQAAVEPGVRLMSVVELMNVNGLGGASTGDLFTGFQCDELGIPLTSNIDGFLQSFRTAIGHAGPTAGLASAGALHDGAGDLHTMAATPNGSLFASTLRYIPWRYMPRNGRMEYTPKFRGNLNLYRTFTSTPTSGSHVLITNEGRQLKQEKIRELMADMGVSGYPVRTATSRGLRSGQAFGRGLVVNTRG